jgi:hypothetical protein
MIRGNQIASIGSRGIKKGITTPFVDTQLGVAVGKKKSGNDVRIKETKINQGSSTPLLVCTYRKS